MNQSSTFDRVLALLHDATLDDHDWPGTSALIDEVCGTKGNFLTFADGYAHGDVQIYIAWFYYRGERKPAFEREYFTHYYPLDERIPRLWKLPDSRVVRVADLYTDEELKTSVVFNDALRHGMVRNGLNVRLDGPNGSRITWSTADPVDRDGWTSARMAFIQRLLPHVRQYVRVRHALATSGAFGVSLSGLLDKTGAGIIHLDARGRILATNDRATRLLRDGDALSDEGGELAARLSADNDELQGVLARALPRFGEQGASGSTAVGRTGGRPGLTIHVSPVSDRGTDFRPSNVAALLLVLDHAPARIDPALVEATLGLSPTESLVAALLAEGKAVRDIAAATSRSERTIRWHVQQVFDKRGISRQVELVRQVLSVAGPPDPPA